MVVSVKRKWETSTMTVIRQKGVIPVPSTWELYKLALFLFLCASVAVHEPLTFTCKVHWPIFVTIIILWGDSCGVKLVNPFSVSGPSLWYKMNTDKKSLMIFVEMLLSCKIIMYTVCCFKGLNRKHNGLFCHVFEVKVQNSISAWDNVRTSVKQPF